MCLLRLLPLAASICLSAAVLVQTARTEEPRWPQFRGPGGLGVAAEGVKLPVAFGPEQGLLWKTPLPVGHSSPCIWGGRIFLTGFDKKANKLETLCLDWHTGKVLWRRTATVEQIEKVHQISNPAASTPATDGERVYVYFASCGLLCYDFDGREQWQRPLPSRPMPFGSGASPIVAGECVLLNYSPKGDPTLVAVDRKTGKIVWQKVRPRNFSHGGVWSTPVHYRADGADLVLAVGGDRLAAYDLADGAERWSVRGLPPLSQGTPVVAEGMVFFTLADQYGDPQDVVRPPPFGEFVKKHDKDGDGKISAAEIPADLTMMTRGREDKVGDWMNLRGMVQRYDRNRDKALDEQEWKALQARADQITARVRILAAAVRLGGQGDVTASHVAWQGTKGVPEVPSPLFYQERLYLVKERGIISCLEPRTGKVLYSERVGAGGQCFASPVAGDGKIYVATDRGGLVVLQAGDQFKVLARNRFPDPILATPAPVDDKLYVRTEKHLYAFSADKGP